AFPGGLRRCAGARLRGGAANGPRSCCLLFHGPVCALCPPAPSAAVMTAELVARFSKRFGTKTVVEADLCRPTDRFSITVLFGPSGSGKTTTLRCLAGLARPEQGHITFDAVPWLDAERRVFRTPQQRDIGYMFQDYALFPHKTVAGNIA